MRLNQLHWLEIVEYLTIVIALIGLAIALASAQLWYVLVPLSIALVLNALNRFRSEQRNRRRIAAASKQLEHKFSEEIKVLAEKLANQVAQTEAVIPESVIPQQMDSQEMASLQDNLAKLQQSLNNVIAYLKNNVLVERVEQLEQVLTQLKVEINRVSRQVSLSSDIALPKLKSPPTQATTTTTSSKPPVSISQIPNWQYLNTLNAHSESVTALAISADSKFLTSGSWDRSLKLWSLATGDLLDSAIEHSQGLLVVTFTGFHGGNYFLATGSFDHSIKLWSIELQEGAGARLFCDRTLTAHTGSVQTLATSLDSQILFSGSYDQTIKQWSIEEGEMLKSSYDELGAIYAIAFHQQGQFIASGGGDGNISLWQLGSGERLGCLSGNLSSVGALTISLDGNWLAAGCVDGTIKLWQLKPSILQSQQNSLPKVVFNAHAGQISALVFSQDGQILFSSGADGQVKLWHSDSGQLLTVLPQEGNQETNLSRIFSLALSADGQFLTAGSVNGQIKIWQKTQ